MSTFCDVRLVSSLVFCTALANIALGCSWSRFDEMRDEPPVELVGASVPRFGTHVASWNGDGEGRLLVLGMPEGARVGGGMYGSSSGRLLHVSSHLCPGDCVEVSSIAALDSWNDGDSAHSGCFFYAVSEQESKVELLGKCVDGSFVSAEIPSAPGGSNDASSAIAEALRQSRSGSLPNLELHLASCSQGVMVASMTGAGIKSPWGWVYPAPVGTAKQHPVLLFGGDWALPSLGDVPAATSIGSSVAVVSVDASSCLVAVAEQGQGEPGKVWLYRFRDGAVVDKRADETPMPAGVLCGVSPQFGAALHAGRLRGDGRLAALLVTAGDSVLVYDASQLYEKPPVAESCGVSLAPHSALVAALGCVQTSRLSECNSSGEFGKSVAFGDLDGDGRDEIAVGAPGMRVNGRFHAGAVLVYRIHDKSNSSEMVEARFVTSAARGDELGFSVAALRDGQRDILAAGIPGKSSVALFGCSSLGGQGAPTNLCR